MADEIHVSTSAPPGTGGFNGKRLWQVQGTGVLYKWNGGTGAYEAADTTGGGGSLPELDPLDILHFLAPQSTLDAMQYVEPASEFGLAPGYGTRVNPITTVYRASDQYSPENGLHLLEGYNSIMLGAPGGSGGQYVVSTAYDPDTSRVAPMLTYLKLGETPALIKDTVLHASQSEVGDYLDVSVLAAAYGRPGASGTTEYIYLLCRSSDLASNELMLIELTLPSTFRADTDPPVVSGVFTLSSSAIDVASFDQQRHYHLVWNKGATSTLPIQNLYVGFNSLHPIIPGNSSFMVARLDSEAVQWHNTYNCSTATRELTALQVSSGDNILVCAGDLLMALSSAGAVVWQNTYTVSGGTVKFVSAKENDSSSLQLVAGTFVPSSEPEVAFVAQLNPSTGAITLAKKLEFTGVTCTNPYPSVSASVFGGLVALSSTEGSTTANVGIEFINSDLTRYEGGAFYALRLTTNIEQDSDGFRANANAFSSDPAVVLNIQDGSSGTPRRSMALLTTATIAAGQFSFDWYTGSETQSSNLTLTKLENSNVTLTTLTITPTSSTEAAATANSCALSNAPWSMITADWLLDGVDGTLPGPVVKPAHRALNGYSLDICTPHPPVFNEGPDQTGFGPAAHHFIIDEDGAWHLGDYGVATALETGGISGQVLTSRGPDMPPHWQDGGATQYVEVSVGQEGTSLAQAFENIPQSHVVYSAQGFDVVAGANSSTTGGFPGVSFTEIVGGDWDGGTLMTLAADGVYSCMFDCMLDIGYLTAAEAFVKFGFGLWLPGDDPALATTYPIFWSQLHGQYMKDSRIRLSRTETLKLSAGSYVLAIGYGGLVLGGSVPGGENATLMRKRTFRLTKH